jgi:hypothetical protein
MVLLFSKIIPNLFLMKRQVSLSLQRSVWRWCPWRHRDSRSRDFELRHRFGSYALYRLVPFANVSRFMLRGSDRIELMIMIDMKLMLRPAIHKVRRLRITSLSTAP